MLFLDPDQVVTAEVRPAIDGDLVFMNHLQDKFAHQLGYLPLQALAKNIERGNVWIGFENGQAAGYVLGYSPYMGREDVGLIYQSALEYDCQRKSIGTQLVEAWAGALSPSVRQIMCWCAQDIAANNFWEALGFLPLGYRAGSARKQRVHIFWNRPLVEDLAELWIPDRTRNGLMRGPREVHLLEPGQDWHERIRVDWVKVEAELVEVKAAAERNRAEKEAAKAAAAAKRQGLDEQVIQARAAELARRMVEAQTLFSARAKPGVPGLVVAGSVVQRHNLRRR